MTTMNNTECKENGFSHPIHSLFLPNITSSMLCAAAPGKAPCKGDSGGPLVTDEGDYNSIIGVVSWGYMCGLPGYPAVFARVTSVLPWIESNISGVKCPKPSS